jgi:glycerophosphoryl diester phosphodiesterase
MVLASSAPVSTPFVIAHRGASGYRPEHTLEAYRLAIEMGADYIEPDLVSTKDGVLIARHEHEIGATTDVAAKFPDRRRTKAIDGEPIDGWFAEDFTLAEIRTLRARERLASRSHDHDGRYEVPTLDEVIALARRVGSERRRAVGIYPETKHPAYFRAIGLPLEEPLLASMTNAGWNHADAPVFIQSFDAGSLRRLRRKTPVRLVQLTRQASLVTAEGVRRIAGYADGLGPEKHLILPLGENGRLGPPTDLVARAHAAGLVVHVWTLRADAGFLPADYRGDAAAEVRRFRDLDVDGLFTDHPDVAVRALRPAGGRNR